MVFFNLLENPNVINLIHIVFVSGLLYALATDRFPDQVYGVSKKDFLLYLSIGVFVYHAYKLSVRMKLEKQARAMLSMEGLNGGAGITVLPLTKGAIDSQLAGANLHHVRMFDSDPGFSVPTMKVKLGDIIVWTNVGEVDHTVTSAKRELFGSGKMEPSGEFHSGYMRPGQTFAMKFLQKGAFPYFCIPHKGWMQGIVVVE